MALLHNTIIQSAVLGHRFAGQEQVLSMSGMVRNAQKLWYTGWHTPNRTSGNPNGTLHPSSFQMPLVSGGLSSYNEISGLGAINTANLAGGLNAIAALTGSGNITSAVGALVVSAIAAITGSGNITSAPLVGKLQAIANLSGSGSVTATLKALASLLASLTGSGGVSSATPAAKGSMAANIRGYSDLTPEGLRDAVWAALMESNVSAKEVMQLIAAFTAGKTDVVDLGGGSATVTFRDLADSKDRIVGNMTSSERTSVTTDTDP